MRVLHAVLVVALVAGSCFRGGEPVPEPVGLGGPVLPAITPVPPPNPVCIPQMGRRRPGSEPRKLRHVSPRFPVRSTPSHFSNTTWLGAAEIDPDGNVANVRTIRSIKVDPPWPELDDWFASVIRQWKYEPVCNDGQPVKVELEVAVHIHLR